MCAGGRVRLPLTVHLRSKLPCCAAAPMARGKGARAQSIYAQGDQVLDAVITPPHPPTTVVAYFASASAACIITSSVALQWCNAVQLPIHPFV